MSALPLPLDRMQRWMQAVVVNPGSAEAGVRSPEAQREVPAERIGDVILPSATLTPVERVGIYHGMYLLRMRDALAGDYPGLEHFLGDGGFLRLVNEYVQAHPSRSHTLNRLGDHLPGFVAGHATLPRREFCAELARLELAVTDVFDAPEAPPLGQDAIAAVPAEAWERARLRPIAAFRLLAFRYPVNAYLQSVRDEDHDHHPKPRLRSEWVAVFRRDYAVYRLELSKPAHDLLADLVRGERLGDAIAAALERPGRQRPSAEDLFRWFREWVSGGIFAEVRLE
ncbi:MAG TPA: DNA-binding domain-containing protein [Vicinamibacteria bacterium]|nr:DNA-binding domain-containing protein [Vicinamibacteria bacterium]